MHNYPVGSQWHGLEDGSHAIVTLVGADAHSRSFASTSGCTWTEPAKFFGPALAWQNCNRDTGTQAIGATSGEIWPLQVGKSQSWSVSGRSPEGESWQMTYTCKVVSAERVSVSAGSFDAYKVVCKDRWNMMTYYYAPSINDFVLYFRIGSGKGVVNRWEYISGPSFPARTSEKN
jgi:hypothetical protein